MRGLKKAAGSRKNKKHRFVPTQPSDQYKTFTIKWSDSVPQKVYVYSSSVDPNQQSRPMDYRSRFHNIKDCFPILSKNLGNV